MKPRTDRVLTLLAVKINARIEEILPEQRVFLKSDSGTHFLRLRPVTQLVALVLAGLGLSWTIVATALVMMQTIGAGGAHEQAVLRQQMFEERLALMSDDRDLRAREAAEAEARFNSALGQVSAMQEMLLASEDRRRELETGIDVVQGNLRQVLRQRDAARGEVDRLTLALNRSGDGRTEFGRMQDVIATSAYLTEALSRAARARDASDGRTAAAEAALRAAADEARQTALRNDAIFARLEEAVTVSMEPLERMFRAAGLNPAELKETVRRGYSGQGGPLLPISASSMGGVLAPEEIRANAILKGMDEMNLYRIAAFKIPLGMPVKAAVRFTSGQGGRLDPFGRGYRRHEGVDMAGDRGTPILSTADGTVTFAGWQNGYGNLVKIQHAFGIETRYGHLSQIRVQAGQKVSRGDRIGDMGSTGRSTGNHLHYEVRIGGAVADPMSFIKAASNVF